MRGAVLRALELCGGAAGLVLVVIWLSGGCGERVAPADFPVPERKVHGQILALEPELESVVEQASGTVAAARRTTISSKILGRIESIRVRAGSVVQRGQLLVRLDARELEARLHANEEALAGARARLVLAEREAKRARELLQSGVGTQQKLDSAEAALRVARAEVERLRRVVEDSRAARSYAEIRAPVDGRVVDRLAEPGDTVAPGQPILRIYDPEALRLEVPVREERALHLSVGEALKVRIPSLQATLEGEVDEIVPYAEPGSRTFLVKIRLPQRPGLYAGMFGRVEIPAGRARRLRVPAPAVEHIGQLAFVTALVGNDRPERRLVTLGAPDSLGRPEVLSGLAPGERILLPTGGGAAADAAPGQRPSGPPPAATQEPGAALSGGPPAESPPGPSSPATP